VDEDSKRITEAGGELIGYAHPLWLTLARHFELGLVVWTSDQDYDALRLDTPTHLAGRRLSRDAAQKVYDEMGSAFKAMAAKAQAIHDPWRPWSDPALAPLDREPLSDWIARQRCGDLTTAALEAQFANTNGAPTTRQSYLANLALVAGAARHGAPDDFFTMSENVRCAAGNEALARALASEIERAGGQIHLSTPVTKIEILDDKVRVTPAAGQPVESEVVILAIPPTMWPSAANTITIEPAIPANYHMTMGIAVKYLSNCATRFWIGEGLAPSGISDACGMLWEGSDNQMQTPEQVVELSLFAGGTAAQHALDIYRAGNLAAVRDYYDKEIKALYPAYPNNRREDTTFVPWPMEPWSMTGYSCPAPGDVFNVSPKLAEPFHRRLFFAGEHTCLPYFGYMEGALQSGHRVAHAILHRGSL
jgi:monoamine oxidase